MLLTLYWQFNNTSKIFLLHNNVSRKYSPHFICIFTINPQCPLTFEGQKGKNNYNSYSEKCHTIKSCPYCLCSHSFVFVFNEPMSILWTQCICLSKIDLVSTRHDNVVKYRAQYNVIPSCNFSGLVWNRHRIKQE